jgi:hypothetical protein
MTYFIEYHRIPTAHNPTQTIETENPQLFLIATGENDLAFTNLAKRKLNIGYGAIISRIYKEDLNKNEIEILYKYKKHFGEKLTLILRPAPTEVLV